MIRSWLFIPGDSDRKLAPVERRVTYAGRTVIAFDLQRHEVPPR